MQTSHSGGFSCYKTRALGKQASAAATQGLISCGSQALERAECSSCGLWRWSTDSVGVATGLFAPRHEGSSRTGDQTAVSPALAGEFLPAAPPGKSFFALFISCLCICVAHILIGLRP